MIKDPLLGEFAEPMSLLLSTHDQMRRLCSTISNLVDHVAIAGANEEARRAAGGALMFFDVGAVTHHMDEEQGLFRLLRAMNDDLLNKAIDRLAAEHRAIESIWKLVRSWLVRVESGVAEVPPRHAIEAFVRRLPVHMDEEERLIYGHACMLEPASMAHLAASMRARRSTEVQQHCQAA